MDRVTLDYAFRQGAKYGSAALTYLIGHGIGTLIPRWCQISGNWRNCRRYSSSSSCLFN